MPILRHLELVLRKISRLGFYLASALLLVVGLIGAADVISSNLFRRPIPGLVELSGVLLAVIVMLGLAEAQARGANIVIDVATERMHPRLRKLSQLFSLLVGVVFMSLVAVQATRQAMNSWRWGETALGAMAFPVAPFKSAAAFGAWLACVEFARQFVVRLFARALSEEHKDA
jgi:TRAP-type C4-dicarboxylate transport system permease small subunit